MHTYEIGNNRANIFQRDTKIREIIVNSPDDLRTDEDAYRLRAMPTKLQIDLRMRKRSDIRAYIDIYIYVYTPKVLRRNSFQHLSVRDSPVRRYAALQCYVQAYITSYAAQKSQRWRVS